MLTIGSLFSGIGGLELGLEWAGLGPVKWQVEIDPFCRQVLAKHWPEVRRFEDVRAVGAELEPVDLICGGFPCQDVSSAGARAGLAGARSGLWREFKRVIGAVRPKVVVVENVASGASLWVDAVRDDLGQLDYASLPIDLAAEDVGAPHPRARIFLVAFSYTDSAGLQGAKSTTRPEARAIAPQRAWTEDAMPKPALCRVDDGPSSWLDRNKRIKSLGNSVVPQCAEVIGWVVREMAGLAP